MEVSSAAKTAVSIADTGTKPEADVANVEKAAQTQPATATALAEAVQPTQAVRLPEHLGNNVNTSA